MRENRFTDMKKRVALVCIFSAHLAVTPRPALAADPHDPVNVVVDSIGLGKSSARITWDTAVPTRFIIRYGRTTAYGTDSTPDLWTRLGSTHHSWYVSGLAPGTTYNFCPQNGDDTPPPGRVPVLINPSICDGTRNNFTFTTLLDDNHPEPYPVQKFVDTTMPSVNGSTFLVKPDCSDLRTQLALAASANGSLTHQVVIPAGTVCDGNFQVLPKSAGNGWIIVRTSTPDNQLPGPDQRITPANLPLMATIRNTNMPASLNNHASLPNCTPGQYVWEDYNVNDPDMPLYYCSATNTWTKVTYLSGTRAQMPATCSPGNAPGGLWYLQTDAVPPATDPHKSTRAWWCLNENGVNKFVDMTMGNLFDGNIGTAAISVPSGAKNYRFVGLNITMLKTPVNYIPLMKEWILAGVDPGADHIIFDRVYIHGESFPSQAQNGIWLDGSNVAMINSYMDKISMWKDPTTFGHYVEESGTGVNVQYGPGPLKLVNNSLSTAGITVFFPEGYPEPADVEIRGNHFVKETKYLYGSPDSDGYFYFNRHSLELKSGRRFLVDGNIFDGNWSVINLNYLIALSVRVPAGSSYTSGNDAQVSDIMISNNIFQHAPAGVGVAGHDDHLNSDADGRNIPEALITTRVKITNNVFRDMGPYRSPLNFYTNDIEGKSIGVSWQPEDLIVTHNTWYNNKDQYGGASKIMTFDGGTAPSSNFIFKDNAGPLGAGLQTTTDIQQNGAAGLNTYWKRLPNPYWSLCNNLLAGPFSTNNHPEDYASSCSNAWPATEADIGFANPAAGDFTVTNPAYKNIASDGTDPGVNMPALNTATAGVLTGGNTSIYTPPTEVVISAISSSISGNTATITWKTNVPADSQVLYGLTSDYTSVTPRKDAVGATAHSVTISGLTNATYHFAVRSMTPAGDVALSSDRILGSSSDLFTLNWPEFVPLNASLTINYGALPVTLVQWNFVQGSGANATSRLQRSTSLISAIASFTTASGAMIPSQHDLTIGPYQATVTLLDANGGVLAKASKDITFVNPNLSTLRVYPNPWRKNSHAGKDIIFDGLTVGTTIKIFTVSGHKVKEISTNGPVATWDLTNESGVKVASGLYIYSATNQDEKVRGKLAVIR